MTPPVAASGGAPSSWSLDSDDRDDEPADVSPGAGFEPHPAAAPLAVAPSAVAATAAEPRVVPAQAVAPSTVVPPDVPAAAAAPQPPAPRSAASGPTARATGAGGTPAPGAGGRPPTSPRSPGDLHLEPTRVPDPRSTVAEKIALGLAIVVAPLGVIASVALAVVSARRRGWVPTILTVAIVVGSVITVAGAGGLAIGNSYAATAIQHRDLEARSQPMCRIIGEYGLDATGADFGWPDPADSIDATVSSIQAYADRWAAVEAVAPDDVKSGAAAIVAAATTIGSGIAQTRTISDADDTARLEALRRQSPVPGWVDEYCGG